MNILAIGPQNVYPATDGGKEGIFGALTALAKKCKVTYAFPQGDFDNIYLEGYEFNKINAVPIPCTLRESVFSVMESTLRLRSFKFEKYSSEECINLFTASLNLEKYDAIVCFHAHTWRLAYQIRSKMGINIPIVLREHNIEYEIVESYLDLLGGARKFFLYPFLWCTKIDEKNIWRKADAVAFLTHRDLWVAKNSGVNGNYFLAPEGVPLPPRGRVDFPGENAPLLILLNPKALQSIENLKIFIEKFWVPIRAGGQLSEVGLNVTGVTTEGLARLLRCTPDYLLQFGIEGLGFVDDLGLCFRKCLALISPTFSGGGIRKKILESMSHQTPVIATKLDIDSCNFFKENENILGLGSATEFYQTINNLRLNAELWVNLSRAGRDAVEKFANWDLFSEAITKEINTLGPGA